jgi:hypothetical protein
MEKATEIILKLMFDVGFWAWGTLLLAKGIGWTWQHTALVTTGVVMLKISMSSWRTKR